MGSIDKACISGFLCRLCSEMHRTVIHIYGEQGKKHGLVEKINGYLPINVSPHDPLPKTICETCLRRVEQHYELLSRLEEYRDSKLMRNMSGLRPRLLRLRTQNHDTGGTVILGTSSLSTFRTSNATAVSGSGSASTDTRNNAASTSLSSPTSTVSASGSNNDHRSVHNDDGNGDNDDDNNMEENVTTEYQVITHPNSPPFYPPHLSSSSSSVQFSPLSGPSSPNNDALTGRNIFLSTNTSSAASSPYTQAPTRLCAMMVRFNNDDDGDDENDEDEDDDDDDDDEDDDDDDDEEEEEEDDDDDDNNNDDDEDEEDEDDSQILRNIEQQESLQSENNEPNTNTRRNEADVTFAQGELDFINLFFR